jgi:hypothetical protein
MLDHTELQESKDRVISIADLYEMQVKDGVDIVDLTLLNTKRGTMGLMMEMFLDQKVEEKALGQLTAAQKKDKWHLTGLARKNGGSRVSTGLQVITDGYVKGNVDVVLSKGPTSEEGNWNNQYLKVMIQWHKRAGDMAMRNMRPCCHLPGC